MKSSPDRNVRSDYPKAADKRKRESAAWPVGCDTCDEALLKAVSAAHGLSHSVITGFQELVYRFARQQGRSLPWRESATPWQVLVSEVMLQQTQVDRIVPRYRAFIKRFPDPQSLSEAPLPELLAAWQGLGYNRRALNLQRAARMIVDAWGGVIPDDPRLLQQLPGIGPYTAGAISSFAFNRPNVFLETNIRAVLLHLFFADQDRITDKQLLPVAEAVLDRASPRDWYNALMDYGSDLKRRFPNPTRRSRHHSVQSRFEGSDRQVRGAVLRLLLSAKTVRFEQLQQQLQTDQERLRQILEGMQRDGLLAESQGVFTIPSA